MKGSTPEAPAALPLEGAPLVVRRSRLHGVRLMAQTGLAKQTSH